MSGAWQRANQGARGFFNNLSVQLRRQSNYDGPTTTAIKRVLEETPTLTVANELGRSENTIQAWINKFRENGIEGLLTKKKGNGPPSQLTPEMEAAMSEQLKLGKWRTGKDAWNWLSENFDVSGLKASVIYKYLGKCGGRLKGTSPCNPEKDEAAEAEFRVTLADKMEDLALPKEERGQTVGLR